MATDTPLPKTLLEAVKYFAVPENCLSYLVASRWPGGVWCPVCKSTKVHFDKTRMGWRCTNKHPKRRFTLKTGTIFEDSPISLSKWLPAVWMIAGAKNGISSHELGRALGVTQKSAWFMLHRIRLAMQNEHGPFSGHVEADETFIGGRARFMHKAKRQRVMKGRTGFVGKTAVLGVLERGTNGETSKVRTRIISNTRRRTLQRELREWVVNDGKTTLYTDALESYRTPALDTAAHPIVTDYIHKVIDHAVKYAEGEVHTNGMENFWSLLKRTIKGTYVSVEPFHLFRYLDEQAFRFNERKGTDGDRFRDAINGILGRRVMYRDLTGENVERP